MAVATASFIEFAAVRVGAPGRADLALSVPRAGHGPGMARQSVAGGVLVHPLNPKGWAAVFAGFVLPGSAPLDATVIIVAIFPVTQAILHPVRTLAGDHIAAAVAGTPVEKYLMWTLAALTVLSVAFVLFGGGAGK